MEELVSILTELLTVFFLSSNLSWVKEKSCFITRLTWSTMDSRRNNQLFNLDCKVGSMKVAMYTGHCVMGRKENAAVPFKPLVKKFFVYWEGESYYPLSLSMPISCKFWFRIFGSPFFVSLTDLSSINIKAIQTYIIGLCNVSLRITA